MLTEIKTIEDARKYRYNNWAGNPKGYKYEEGYCAEEIADSGGWMYYQCRKKNGKGLNGLFCGIHAKKHPLQ